MWWWSTMPPSAPSPRRRATRFARPGADSTISLAMPSRSRTSARKRAPASSPPGGLVVSIRRYRVRRSIASSPSAVQSMPVAPLTWPRSGGARGEILDGDVLVRPPQVDPLLPRGVARPVRVPEVRAREHAEVGAPGGEDRVDVRPGGDVADGHRGDPRLLADAVGERRLVEPPVDGLLLGPRLARRDVHDVAPVLAQHAGELDGLLRRRAALGPVCRRDPDGHGPGLRPRPPHGVEDLERPARAVGERAAG